MSEQIKEPINPQHLLEDNYSDKAGENIEKILQLRKEGQLILLMGCSDARLILPDDVYQIRTISATGPRSPWEKPLNYGRTAGVIIMDHLYCGGLLAKAQLPENILDDDTALGFVKDHVWTDDPIVQSILTGSWTASRTQKPVLSAVQNPYDGSVYIQGAFNNGEQTEHKTIPTYKLMQRYIKEKLYGDEIPQLRPDLVLSIFSNILGRLPEKVKLIAESVGDLTTYQGTQDPEVVAVTSNLKALSARFPALFGLSNTVFQVSLRRQSLDIEGELETNDVREVFRQIHYPLSHCIENNKSEGRLPFKSTRVLYLETGDMKDSLRLAHRVKRRREVQEWLDLPGRVIIAAQAVRGRIQQIELVV